MDMHFKCPIAMETKRESVTVFEVYSGYHDTHFLISSNRFIWKHLEQKNVLQRCIRFTTIYVLKFLLHGFFLRYIHAIA